MTGLELSLSALVSAIKFGFEFIIGRRNASAETRKRWFEDYIEPSYEQLCSIHEDYSKQFSSAIVRLNEGTKLEEVALILKRERPNLLLKRQEVRESLIALRDYRLNKKRKPEIDIAFYDYVQKVEQYLHSASPLGRETWYSYFIDRFSELDARDENPLEDEYSACAEGRRAPTLAKEQLELAIHRNMPESFRSVQEKYFRIRAACLSQL